jgi:hypothetical protein
MHRNVGTKRRRLKTKRRKDPVTTSGAHTYEGQENSRSKRQDSKLRKSGPAISVTRLDHLLHSTTTTTPRKTTS